MKHVFTIAALAALTLSIAACDQFAAPAAKPIGEADAAKIADATVAAWYSMDAARVKALYAPGVVGFDYGTAPLVTNRAAWDKNQDSFAAAKIDKFVQKERNIQVLDADTFVMSGTWYGTSTAKPDNDGTIRCTDVFEKGKDGKWLIANEHCSTLPR